MSYTSGHANSSAQPSPSLARSASRLLPPPPFHPQQQQPASAAGTVGSLPPVSVFSYSSIERDATHTQNSRPSASSAAAVHYTEPGPYHHASQPSQTAQQLPAQSTSAYSGYPPVQSGEMYAHNHNHQQQQQQQQHKRPHTHMAAHTGYAVQPPSATMGTSQSPAHERWHASGYATYAAPGYSHSQMSSGQSHMVHEDVYAYDGSGRTDMQRARQTVAQRVPPQDAMQVAPGHLGSEHPHYHHPQVHQQHPYNAVSAHHHYAHPPQQHPRLSYQAQHPPPPPPPSAVHATSGATANAIAKRRLSLTWETARASGVTAEPASDDETGGKAENRREKRSRTIHEHLTQLYASFMENKENVYREKSLQYKTELRKLLDGTHDEFQEKLSELARHRDEAIEHAELSRDYQLRTADQLYAAESEQAESEYRKDMEELRDRLLQDLEERRRKLREEKDALDVNSDLSFDAFGFGPARTHNTRALRKKGQPRVGVVEHKLRRGPRLQLIPLSFAASSSDVEEDLSTIHRGTTGKKAKLRR